MKAVLKKNILILLLMCLVVLSEQQATFELKIFQTSTNTGPVTKAFCTVTFPVESTHHTIIWKFKGQQLAMNGTETEHISDRTYVQYNELINEEWKHLSILSIYRTEKNDDQEGIYTCLAEYYDDENTKHEDEKTIFVPILNYLPPPDHPMCSASPSVVNEGDDVTFRCDPGDSNPPMNLTLVLKGPDEAETYLGSLPEITEIMTIHNNNSNFVCYMNSTLYANVNRQCSMGPIIVFPQPSTPSQDSTTDSSSTQKPNPLPVSTSSHDNSMESSSTMESSSASKPKVLTPSLKPSSAPYPPAPKLSSEVPSVEFSSAFSGYSTVTINSNSTLNNTQFFTPITIGSFGAGFVLITILLLITICLLLKRNKTSTEPSTGKDHPMDNIYIEKATSNVASNKTQDDSMQVYSEVDKDTPNPKTTSNASNHTNELQDKSDQETNEDLKIPVYAISSMAGAADNSTGDKMTNEMPIYSQVNKGSDMVENMIYEPAGPM